MEGEWCRWGGDQVSSPRRERIFGSIVPGKFQLPEVTENVSYEHITRHYLHVLVAGHKWWTE